MKKIMLALCAIILACPVFGQGTDPPGSKPGPIYLTVEQDGPAHIQLRWAVVEGAVKYEIDRKFAPNLDSVFDWWTICDPPAEWGGAMGFDLFPGYDRSHRGTYTHRVRAVFEDGSKSAYTKEVEVVVQPHFLEDESLVANAASTTRINLEWGTFEGEVGFEIWEKLTNKWELREVVPADTLFFTVKDLYSNSSYDFRVRAILPDGEFSDFSKVASAKTFLPIAETPPEYSINENGELEMILLGEELFHQSIHVSSDLVNWRSCRYAEVNIKKIEDGPVFEMFGIPSWRVTLKKHPEGKPFFMRLVEYESGKGKYPQPEEE